jgi:hypothetical protein
MIRNLGAEGFEKWCDDFRAAPPRNEHIRITTDTDLAEFENVQKSFDRVGKEVPAGTEGTFSSAAYRPRAGRGRQGCGLFLGITAQ